MKPRDGLDVLLGATATALLNVKAPVVRLVAVVALVDAPADSAADEQELRTAIAAESAERGPDVVALLRQAADKIEAHGLGAGIDLGRPKGPTH